MKSISLNPLLEEPQLFGDIKAAVSNKGRMQVTYVMLKFLVAILKRSKKKWVKFILMIYFI